MEENTLWEAPVVPSQDSIGEVLRNQLLQSKLFWTFCIVLLAFFLFISKLSSVDLLIGAILIALGIGHFIIQIRNALQLSYLAIAIRRSGLVLTRRKTTEHYSWDEIKSYQLDRDESLQFAQLKIILIKRVELFSSSYTFDEEVEMRLASDKQLVVLLKRFISTK